MRYALSSFRSAIVGFILGGARCARVLVLTAFAVALFGATLATSADAAKVTPVNTQAPAATGTPAVGQTLTCSTGSWNGNPNSFAYKWLRNGVAIPGQVSSTYVVESADEGAALSCEVTANILGGEYSITGLPSGEYDVFFEPTTLSGDYLPQYFSGKTSLTEATFVKVTAPAQTGGINAALAVGGEITGKVTNSSGAPVAGTYVCASSTSAGGGCVETGASGEYTIMSLQTGRYKVEFYGEVCTSTCTRTYAPQYYNDKASEGEAEEIAVTAPNATPNVNAVLTPLSTVSGAISGTVEGAASAKLAHVEVCAENEEAYGCAETNAAGAYTVSDLPTGEYTVYFSTTGKEGPHEYVGQWYDGTLKYYEATPVDLTAPETKSGIDATLSKGAKLVGTVKSASTGAPLAEVNVCANEEEDIYGNCVDTSAAGTYEIEGLPSGANYTVDAYSYAENSDYLYKVVEHVELTAPNTKTVEFTLSEGANISGRVTTATGAPLRGDSVCAYEEVAGEELAVSCAESNANGEYTLIRIPSGSYRVYFDGDECSGDTCVTNYLGQYYDSGALITVEQPKTTGGIDAALAEGGKIAGMITSAATGAPVIDAYVCADSEKSGGYGCTYTGETGNGASAHSNSLNVPAPNSHFKLLKSSYNSKKGDLDLVFELPNAGTLTWSLGFPNANVDFTDAFEMSAALDSDPLATTAKHGKGKSKGKGKKAKCHKGETKHKGKCVVTTVSFAKGSESVAAGRVEVAIKASAAAKKGLKAGHTLHVSGPFVFSSSLGGAATTVEVKSTIKPSKAKKRGKGKKKHGKSHKKHG